MDLLMIGINFRTAPIELREKVSFSAKAVPAVLGRLSAAFPGTELVLVSTCNRTELYAAAPAVEGQKSAILGALLKDTGAPPEEMKGHFYDKSGLEAVQHLFAVASGLDSMVVGEAEILGQVRQAYALAVEAETSGERLHPLFQNALKTAKRVRTETDISRGRVSVSSIAVEFVEKIFDDLSAKTVMIVGAGETAELVLKSLLERGVKEVLVLNRSQPKCQSLAERYGGRAIPFDLLPDYLPRADIVMSSTSAPHCVIHVPAVQNAMQLRHGDPMLLMDIAVPRDIEAGVAELENVYLYNVDDLEKIAAANLAKREIEVEKAWKVVRADMAEAAALFGHSDLGALMRQFDEQTRRISAAELGRLLGKPAFASMPEAQRQEIAELLHRSMNKILAGPRKGLRKASRDGRWDEYSRVVRDAFEMDAEAAKEEDHPHG